jgi:hypothetical protein
VPSKAPNPAYKSHRLGESRNLANWEFAPPILLLVTSGLEWRGRRWGSVRGSVVFAEPEPSVREEPDRVTAHTFVFCFPCTPPSSSSAPTSRTSPLHRRMHFG